EAVKGLKADEVNAALRDIFQGQGPLLFVTTPKEIEGGEAALAVALKEAEDAPVTALAASENKTWTYANSFGAPGKIKDKSEVADMGATFVRFVNGVRLTVKPTKLTDQQILVNVRI